MSGNYYRVRQTAGLNLEQGIGLQNEHRAMCINPIPEESIVAVHVAHDNQTICVITKKTVAILDNPLI